MVGLRKFKEMELHMNKVLEDHGSWLLVDISTRKYPNATMAVDADVFAGHKGGRISANIPVTGKYIRAMYNHEGYKLFHRDVIDCGKGDCVDHIEHGTESFIDNRKSNLRLANKSQNAMNRGRSIKNRSGTTGVYWNERAGKWAASICVNYKSIFLGYWEDVDDAAKARKDAELKYFGEFQHGVRARAEGRD